MTYYIARRIILSLFTIWVISVLSFMIIQLPEGDAADKIIQNLMVGGGTHGHVGNPDLLAHLRDYLDLDKPSYVRYSNWVWRMLHGDLGFAASMGEGDAYQGSMKRIIGDRLLLTVALTGFTIVITWVFAIPVGIYSAVRKNSIGDYTFTLLGFTGLAVPDFLLGLVLMYVAYAYFNQSVGGLFSADYINADWSLAKVRDLLNHLWIPAIVLGTSGTAGLIRVMRNNLLDELAKPYVITARAKGLPSVRLITKYPVRVALNPLISTVGYLLPSLVSGSVIVSVVLSLPTLGPILLTAILREDTNVAGFIVLMLGILTVLGTLISDLLLALVDPRIKLTT